MKSRITKTKPMLAMKFLANCDIKRLHPFGAIAPIIVDENFQICAGHIRFKAAVEIGRKTFPVIIVLNLTGDNFRAYNIADNIGRSVFTRGLLRMRLWGDL